MKITAVVVTYNRVELLEQCLLALQGQTRALDEIIIVNNASTDGTSEMLAEKFPRLAVFDTGANLGGAGGFAWAVELAIALGYDGAWLMDDDAMPAADCLEKLITDESLLSPEGVGFLVSTPATQDHELADTNHPIVDLSLPRQYAMLRRGYLSVRRASFVGVLVNLHRAKTIDLPYSDFFIWGDDCDYTDRLSYQYDGVTRLDSLIVHDSPAMSALVQARSVGWKYRYLVRNSLWEARWSTDPVYRLYKVLQVPKSIVRELRYAPKKIEIVRTTIASVWSGLTHRRRSAPVGSLLAASRSGQQWVKQRLEMSSDSA